MYLEDPVVTKSRRGVGAGRLLFEEVFEIGKASDCTGMMWQVLDRNESAIDFYKKHNTAFDKGRENCPLHV